MSDLNRSLTEALAQAERDNPFRAFRRQARKLHRSLAFGVLDRVSYGIGYVAGCFHDMGAARLGELVYGIVSDGSAKSDGYDDALETAEDRRWREYGSKSESTLLRDLCALVALALFVSGLMAFTLLASASPHAIKAAECAHLAAINGSCSF